MGFLIRSKGLITDPGYHSKKHFTVLVFKDFENIKVS